MSDLKQKELEYWNQPDLKAQHVLIAGPTPWEASEASLGTHWDMITHGVQPLPEGAAILEIGCGIGRILKHVSTQEKSWQLSGVDISSNMLSSAREYLGPVQANLQLVVDEQLPFSNESFDFVYSFLVFQHIPARARILRYLEEICRVLRPGGQVRIQTYKGAPHPESGYGYTHGCFYPSLEEFAGDFSKAGLTVVGQQQGSEKLLHNFDKWLWVTAKK